MQSHCPEARQFAACDPNVNVEQTGAAAWTRSSTAASYHVIAPPPEIPVTPMRRGSTSGRVSM